MPTGPCGLDRLLDEQSGLTFRGQLVAHGITPATVRAHLRARRWRQVHRGVVATFTGPLPRLARLHAALLYAGAPALLSHRTAAEEWGLLRVDDRQPVHVTVPYSCHATSTSGVRVHRSKAFTAIAVDAHPPRTARADTVIDLAAAEASPAAATRAVVSVGAGAVPVRHLRMAVERRRPWRYRRAIQRGIDLLAHGTLSALEQRYLTEVEQRHGLPVSLRQRPVVVDGRTLWEDCSYERTGVPLIVRLDGRLHHAIPEVAFRDRRRDNAAELTGTPRLAYGWEEVDGDACGVAAEVLAVLRRGGWSDTPDAECPAVVVSVCCR